MKYRQMAWLDPYEGASNKILHLRADNGTWQPYSRFPDLCKPDLNLPGASKGYPTMQSLLKQGYQLVPTKEAIKEQQLVLN